MQVDRDSGGRLIAVGVSATAIVGQGCSALLELPAATLRQRRVLEGAVGGLGVVAREENAFGYRGLDVQRNYGPTLCSEPTPLANARVDLAGGAWCVRGRLPDGRSVVRVGSCSNDAAGETARCVLEGTAGARLQGPVAILFDTRGRVMVLDTSDGALVTELLLRI